MALTLVTSDLIGGLDYSKLTGTVPTWNQNTSGTAAGLSATLAVGTGGTGVTSITALKNVLDDETWTFANDTTFSGKVKVSDGGNATTPSFRIGSDTNGISTPSTNQLNFITNSLTRLTITSGGYVGIGIAPSTKFQVNDGQDINLAIKVGQTNTSAVMLNAYNNGATANIPMEFRASSFAFQNGNVGIGTADPSNSKLTISDGVAGYSTANVLLQVKRNATNSNDDTSRSAIMLANNSNAFTIAYGGATDRLRFINGSGNEQLTLLNGGNLGIGTTSPNYLLDLQSSETGLTHNLKLNKGSATGDYAEIAFQLWNGAGSGLNTFGGSGTSRPSVVLRAINESANSAAGAFVVGTFTGGTNNSTLTEKLRISSGGDVTIGSSNDPYLYMISSGGNGYNSRFRMYGYADGGTYGGGFKIDTRNSSNVFNNALTISSGGEVSVNNKFSQNSVGRRCNSGSTTGNASFYVDYTVTSQSSLKVTAVFNHYGYITSYGCARFSLVGLGPAITTVDISTTTSGNGGSWSFSRINSTTLRVTKNAGTYSGSGYWFIEVIGAQVS